jgi:shikimate 5-dehydrogenase
VNTLVLRDGRLQGSSTDAAILAGLEFERAAILGDGGAAAAFAVALPTATRFSRRGLWPPDLDGIDLVVNATSERDAVLVELGSGQTLIDLPYPATATAREAELRGAHVVDGLNVLVAQGAASFEAWTGIPAPLDVMEAAVRTR